MELTELNRLKALKEAEEESKAEATDRIIREMHEEAKIKARKESVKVFFKELAGREMTDAEFLLYNERFNREEPGYNIKSFIKEIGANLTKEYVNNEKED